MERWTGCKQYGLFITRDNKGEVLAYAVIRGGLWDICICICIHYNAVEALALREGLELAKSGKDVEFI